MALNEFEGTVMLVSHGRALLRAVCDEFWMVSRGGAAPFDGALDDYQRYLLDEAKRQCEAIKEAANGAAKVASQALKKEAAAHTADEQSKAQQRRMDGGKQSGKPEPPAQAEVSQARAGTGGGANECVEWRRRGAGGPPGRIAPAHRNCRAGKTPQAGQ